MSAKPLYVAVDNCNVNKKIFFVDGKKVAFIPSEWDTDFVRFYPVELEVKVRSMGKGQNAYIKKVNGKNVIFLPDNIKESHVKIVKLKKIVFPLEKK